MKEFAENLRRLRQEQNLNQKQLVDITSISVKTIQNYEQNRGGCSPAFPNLMLLADFFHVTPYYLYYGGNKEMLTNSSYMNELMSELDRISKISGTETDRARCLYLFAPKCPLSA